MSATDDDMGMGGRSVRQYVSQPVPSLVGGPEGLLMRDDKRDKQAWDQVKFWAALAPGPGDRALDLGAHIGCWVRRYAHQADHVLAVEAHPENYAVLVQNVEEYQNVDTLHAAVGGSMDEVPLFVNVGNSMGHSLFVRGRRPAMMVPGVPFGDLLEREQPTLIKIDVEGAEFHFGLEYGVPDYVRGIGIELHLSMGGNHMDHGRAIMARLEEQGFRPHKPYDFAKALQRRPLPGGAWVEWSALEVVMLREIG
jgi:FkbM family methyltransferase